MRTYEQERAFLERVAEELRERGRAAQVEHTGGGILSVLVPFANEVGPGRAFWYCGTMGETWAGSLIDEESGDGLGREFETDVPSDGEDEAVVARAVLRAIRLEEATPDAPTEYVERVARWMREDARGIAEHGTPGGLMDQFLKAARARIARAFEEGYRRAIAETGLVE